MFPHYPDHPASDRHIALPRFGQGPFWGPFSFLAFLRLSALNLLASYVPMIFFAPEYSWIWLFWPVALPSMIIGLEDAALLLCSYLLAVIYASWVSCTHQLALVVLPGMFFAWSLCQGWLAYLIVVALVKILNSIFGGG